MAIDTELIKFPADELAGLQLFFPRNSSGRHVVRYNLVEAGKSTGQLLNHDFKGSTSIGFTDDEAAFIASVFERLSSTIAIAPEAVDGFDAPQQLDLASVERIAAGESTDGIMDTWVPLEANGELKSDEAYVTGQFELNHDPGLSNYEEHLIVHELGHALGLEHPAGKPNSRQYDDRDTVMSYNKGGETYATWFSTADLTALAEIWGQPDDAVVPPETTTPEHPFLIDQLISGGFSFPDFNPADGHILSIDRDLLQKASRALKIVTSERGLNKAAQQRKQLVFDDRTNQLYLNHNRQGDGWGEDGGLLASFADDVFLIRQNLQLV
ncbi:MAG: hypothetical protein ACPHGV_09735 [Synechococcus sp.]